MTATGLGLVQTKTNYLVEVVIQQLIEPVLKVFHSICCLSSKSSSVIPAAVASCYVCIQQLSYVRGYRYFTVTAAIAKASIAAIVTIMLAAAAAVITVAAAATTAAAALNGVKLTVCARQRDSSPASCCP